MECTFHTSSFYRLILGREKKYCKSRPLFQFDCMCLGLFFWFVCKLVKKNAHKLSLNIKIKKKTV